MSYDLMLQKECEKLGVKELSIKEHLLINYTNFMDKKQFLFKSKDTSNYIVPDNNKSLYIVTPIIHQLFIEDKEFKKELLNKLVPHFKGEGSPYEEDREIEREVLKEDYGNLHTIFKYKEVDFYIESFIKNGKCETTICLWVER